MPDLPEALPRFRILIGAPGAGKSTWCRNHPHEAGHVLSLDQERARLGAHEHDQSASTAAVNAAAVSAEFWLCLGETVTLDATSSTASQRARWLDLAVLVGAVPTALLLRTPLDLCLARNAVRRRPVPTDVVMTKWFEISRVTRVQLLNEGFASVSEVTEYPTPPC